MKSYDVPTPCRVHLKSGVSFAVHNPGWPKLTTMLQSDSNGLVYVESETDGMLWICPNAVAAVQRLPEGWPGPIPQEAAVSEKAA